jgi:hypothetical protein
MYLRDYDALLAVTRTEFKALHSIHWGIECYHRSPHAGLRYSTIYGESVGAGGLSARAGTGAQAVYAISKQGIVVT